ncbi:hypothetical protein [Luteibacter yeojuensis]|uniref:Uncharacterized protein n=1 Tax=Luteibacter yeojuensis TaxID=345309 RepID=A0A7X5QW32_9GAMM|nr:hypothetical protein [Luteibacter yeojuensis]NID16394.1 hypothetical protein [Luteibacter yeojuensis]
MEGIRRGERATFGTMASAYWSQSHGGRIVSKNECSDHAITLRVKFKDETLLAILESISSALKSLARRARQDMVAPTVDGAEEDEGIIPYFVFENGLSVHARYGDFHPHEPVAFIIESESGLPLRESAIVPDNPGLEVIHGFRYENVAHLAGQTVDISFRLPSRVPELVSAPRKYVVARAGIPKKP